ncbi:hypothetical protein [Acinetobacter wuhouensis]|uniref:hypothetical protein n=1 Tax=Acinetobacter wuhouensis TaxID=1879050 RepID=UPI0013CEF1D8|nr:hypothetical protein [Acinetobacter wuhouensis]
MTKKCESCRHGLDGRNGNGYSPCGCEKKIVVIGVPSRVSMLVQALCSVLSKPPKLP